MNKIVFIAVILFLSVILSSCKKDVEKYAKRIHAEDNDDKIIIYCGGQIICQVTVISNSYNVQAYANDFPVIECGIMKGAKYPSSHSRLVEINNKLYLLVYNELGEVESSHLITGDKENDGAEQRGQSIKIN